MTLFSINDIIKIEASKNYSVLYFINRENIVSAKNLKIYERVLTPYFIRCRRNLLINTHYIKKLSKEIILTTGETLLFSRRRFKEFKS